MNLWKLLTCGRPSRLQARLANEIAQRSLPEAWERIERRVVGMRLAEARGYIRARVAQIVHREADLAIALQSAEPSLERGRLVAQATDALVALLFRELMHVPAKYHPLVQAA
jgi:hypothetical protein